MSASKNLLGSMNSFTETPAASSQPHAAAAAAVSIASHLAISAVERDTGLSKDVLRVWERRYGFPLPERDANGERLYPLSQVERLRTIKRLMDSGHRPGKLLSLSETNLNSLANRQSRPRRGDESGDLQRQVIELIRGHDMSGLRERLSLWLMKQGLQEFVVETVAPLNRAVTEAWMRGELAVFEERAYAELLQVVLRSAMLQNAHVQGTPRFLLATLPNEVSSLGLLMMESLLSPEGVRCISLGTQVPIPEIAAAVNAFDADIVALAFSASFSSKQAVASLESIRSVIPDSTAIWVGGELIRRLRRDIPGITPTGTLADMLAALRQWRVEHPAD
jgi:MerR family transcriptional regulator, light-induced transcriptional regulator